MLVPAKSVRRSEWYIYRRCARFSVNLEVLVSKIVGVRVPLLALSNPSHSASMCPPQFVDPSSKIFEFH
jgi:hypothetical protein